MSVQWKQNSTAWLLWPRLPHLFWESRRKQIHGEMKTVPSARGTHCCNTTCCLTFKELKLFFFPGSCSWSPRLLKFYDNAKGMSRIIWRTWDSDRPQSHISEGEVTLLFIPKKENLHVPLGPVYFLENFSQKWMKRNCFLTFYVFPPKMFITEKLILRIETSIEMDINESTLYFILYYCHHHMTSNLVAEGGVWDKSAFA